MLPTEHHHGFALVDTPGFNNKRYSPALSTVLVVEDNPINQRIAKLVLATLSVNVIVASNGEEALRKLRENNCTMILMDCQMPVMDGFEASRTIREIEQHTGGHIPIIAVTASGNREECLAAGMDDHILKPLTSTGALAKLQLWLAMGQPS